MVWSSASKSTVHRQQDDGRAVIVSNRLSCAVTIAIAVVPPRRGGPPSVRAIATADDDRREGTHQQVIQAASSDIVKIPRESIKRRRCRLLLHAQNHARPGGRATQQSAAQSTTLHCQMRFLASAKSTGTDDRVSTSDVAQQRWHPIKLNTLASEGPTSSKGTFAYALQTIPSPRDGPDVPCRLLLLPTRLAATFLASLANSAPLSALCLPGSHETFARYGWPISQCQELTSSIAAQLRAGMRFMDFRVTPKGEPGKERLLAYHGAIDERIELGAALQQVYDFLEGEGATETVIISLKPEKGDPALMQRLLFDLYIDKKRDRWYLEPRIPTLGEARGKAVMFSRFGKHDEQPGGIHPVKWPNNFKGLFQYDLPDADSATISENGEKETISVKQGVTTQDWFSIGSIWQIEDKYRLATELLDSPAASDPNQLALNFTSASTFPLALPPSIAKGVFESGPRCIAVRGMNSRIRDFVATKLALATPSAPCSVEKGMVTSPSSAPSSSSFSGQVHASPRSSSATYVVGPGAVPDVSQTSAPSMKKDATQGEKHTAGDSKTSLAPPSAALPGLQATFAIDYFDYADAADLVPLLIEANFTAAAAAVEPAPGS